VEEEEAAVARQCRSKHVSAATNKYATTDELLGVAFSVWSMPRLYNQDLREK
jgi:hypothetical protein